MEQHDQCHRLIKRADGLIRYGNQTDLATVDDQYIAVIETSTYGPASRASARIPPPTGLCISPTAHWTAAMIKVAPSMTWGIGFRADGRREYPA